MGSRHRVLVLNADYQPVSTCTAERAFVLVYLHKAEAVHHDPGRCFRTVSGQHAYPSIIRLRQYVHTPFKRVSLNRGNIFRRDGYACLYCGSTKSLTIDHVIPRSQGGRDTWENLVTCCQRCNTFKGNRTPDQAGLTMRHKPYRPSFIMFLADFSRKVDDAWRPYLMLN
jgi:5-methylcytosine-specific restriction endonuclease McrA